MNELDLCNQTLEDTYCQISTDVKFTFFNFKHDLIFVFAKLKSFSFVRRACYSPQAKAQSVAPCRLPLAFCSGKKKKMVRNLPRCFWCTWSNARRGTYCSAATQHLHEDVWRRSGALASRFCLFNFPVSSGTMHLFRKPAFVYHVFGVFF